MFQYEWNCERCSKVYTVLRHHTQSGQPYACPDCGGDCTRIYSAGVEKERLYEEDGRRFTNFREHEKHLKSKGRVLTESTRGWKDIQRMAKDGQRRTQLSQKGHY